MTKRIVGSSESGSLEARTENVKGLTPEEVERARGDMFRGLAASTRGTYAKYLTYFEKWRGPRGIDLSDISTSHVTVYLDGARSRSEPVSVSWMRGSVAALKKALEWHGALDHVDWGQVNLWINQERIDDRTMPASVDGLTWELIEKVVTAAWAPKSGEWPEKTTRRATLDSALMWLMWSCLLRRSEAAAAKWGDIKVEQVDGHLFGVLTIPFSKTDKYGRGEVGYVHLDTLALLQEMAVACGRDPSRDGELIFGIGERQVWNRIHAACAHAGLPGRWGGHSLRIGAARDLTKHGTGLVGTMQAGRWQDPRTLWRYVRAMAVGDGAVARLHAEMERDQGLWSMARTGRDYEAR